MVVRNGCGVMEGVEERQPENGAGGVAAASSGGGVYVKVMTDEQMEVLRRQISVYATICEQLVEMHKAVTAQQDSVAGMRLGNIYCDPLMGGSHKITTRQRWTPSQMQLQILENIFEQGNGTPSKQKIKEITSELMQHGPISETNVYNWFQNRRARSKRKQQVGAPNNMESGTETEVESPKEKKTKVENIQSHEKPALHVDDMSYHCQEVSSSLYLPDPQSSKVQQTQSNDNSKSSGSLSPFSFFENMLANPRIEHLLGKMESQDFNPFHTSDGFDVIG
ncbi:unnamed protein product [Victoria cruziana]